MTTHPSTEEEGSTTINKPLKDVTLPVAVTEELDMTRKTLKNTTLPLAEEEGINMTDSNTTLSFVYDEGPNMIINNITLPLPDDEGPNMIDSDITFPLAEEDGSRIIDKIIDDCEIMTVPGSVNGVLERGSNKIDGENPSEEKYVSQDEDNNINDNIEPLPKNGCQDEKQQPVHLQKQEITTCFDQEVTMYRDHDHGSLPYSHGKLSNIEATSDVNYKDIKDDHNFPLPSFPAESLNDLNAITGDNSLPTEEPPPPLHAVIFARNQININDKDIVVTPSPLPSHYIGETYEWMTKLYKALYHQECLPYPRNVVITLSQVLIEEVYFGKFDLPHEVLEMEPGHQRCIVSRMQCIFVWPNSEMVVTKVV